MAPCYSIIHQIRGPRHCIRIAVLASKSFLLVRCHDKITCVILEETADERAARKVNRQLVQWNSCIALVGRELDLCPKQTGHYVALSGITEVDEEWSVRIVGECRANGLLRTRSSWRRRVPSTSHQAPGIHHLEDTLSRVQC